MDADVEADILILTTTDADANFKYDTRADADFKYDIRADAVISQYNFSIKKGQLHNISILR